LLRDYRKRFRVLYETPRAADLQLQAKTDLLAALRADYAALKAGWGGYAGYDRVLGADFNNATLVSFALYGELVPAFELLLQQEGHDLQRFYRRVSELATLDKDARHSALSRLLPAATDATTEESGRLLSERTGGSGR
jgi:predicted aminopeptidase